MGNKGGAILESIPGNGIDKPGRGTLKGGTITEENAGMAAVGCGTVWGNGTGKGWGPVATVTVPAGGFKLTIGVTATLCATVIAGDSSGPSGPVPGVGRRGDTTVVHGVVAELKAVDDVWLTCELLDTTAAGGRLFEGLGPEVTGPADWFSIIEVSSAC